MWLLRLPRVASVVPARSRMAAVISLTVVLPLLPATPTTGIENRARQAAAELLSAAWVSATTICASGDATGVSTTAPAAPALAAAATKSLALKRGPRSATNSSPALQRARVGGHAGVGAIGALERAAAGLREIGQRAAHAAPPARDRQRVRDHLLVAERPALAAVDLVVLVALARDQHHVGRLRIGERIADGARAIELDAKRLAGGNARGDVRGDALRRLGARIVVGDHDVVGELGRDGAHDRALARVAIAAATEDHRKPAGAMRARRRQAPCAARRACARSRPPRAAPACRRKFPCGRARRARARARRGPARAEGPNRAAPR